MDIVVCVKRVAEHAEAEFEVDESGKRLRIKGAAYDINEWDDYALEEALRLKERLGGRVTAITVGGDEAEEVLRKCLAKGADEAIRINGEAVEGADAYVIAKVLKEAIRQLSYDLILTGVQASDDSYSLVGQLVAEMLGIPYVTLVKRLEVLERGWVKVHRELEGGLEEVVEVRTPTLLTIQTGINEPRYVSIMGIRRASKKPLRVVKAEELGLKREELGEEGSWLKLMSLYIPKVERRAELLEGPADKVAQRIIEILKERGLLA